MTTASVPDPRRATLWATGGHEHDMMSTQQLGFWLYMLSDSLIFAALFAAYEVLTYKTALAGGPGPREVAAPIHAYIATIVLSSSVLAYGMAMVELKRDRPRRLMAWIGVAFVIGLDFIVMEWDELAHLAASGAVPQHSGYLSIFFTLIIVHGLHNAFGLLWMLVMIVQVARKGLKLPVVYRLINLKIFWLYQALVWTFVYTFVYLRGSV